MFKTITLGVALAIGVAAGSVSAATVEGEVTDFNFSFEGPFGSYDRLQLQRGLQIYTEICSACHGMKFVAFRTLSDEGGPALPEDQMRAYAENFDVWDPTLFDGEGDFRPATPADHFPASSMSTAPDLSLMAKARKGFEGPYGSGLSQLFNGMGGAEYVASLLAGYVEAPSCAPEDFPGYYNHTFTAGGYPEECRDEKGKHLYPGSWIAMPPPLYGEDLDFADGHSNSLENEAQDVAAFLMWAAEPHLNARKQAGLTGVIFLTILTVLLYLTNKRIWGPVKHPRKT
jgi:ubiquinol-cytochrome c reductase cytochrome c1 subunit